MDAGEIFRIPKFRAYLDETGQTWVEFTANGPLDRRGKNRRVFVVMVLGIETVGRARINGDSTLERMGWTRPCAERPEREPSGEVVEVSVDLLRDAIDALTQRVEKLENGWTYLLAKLEVTKGTKR